MSKDLYKKFIRKCNGFIINNIFNIYLVFYKKKNVYI